PWFMAKPYSLKPEGVVEAVINGIADGVRDFKIQVNLIGILSRTYGPDIAWKELQALLRYRDRITALDLAGDEANYPAELFGSHFQQAIAAGWRITCHAGESAGAESIWRAIKELGAARIGHGVRAPEDPKLMDYLAEQRIGIETSLTSNVQTSTVPDYPSHPLRLFLQKGLLATINTDDPGISAINLRHEYEVAAPAAGLSPEMILRAQRNALEVAFLSSEEKAALVAKKAG
ncbi:MAG: adenosine deaminase, partial [Anaerolineaceae bacterium]|nr:adenosine deaminase [Anaerolineaceae bacterium]